MNCIKINNIKNDFSTIVNLLNITYKNKIPINLIISYLQEIYPVGKTFIRTRISYILKIKLKRNQKYIKKQYYKKLLLKTYLTDVEFSVIEVLYCLYKNNIKIITRKKIYEILSYNYQISYISYEEFKNALFGLKIYKKNIFINKKILDNLIFYYKLDKSKLYNNTYILKV